MGKNKGGPGPKLKSNPELYLEVRFTSPRGEDGAEWALGWYVFAYSHGDLRKETTLEIADFKKGKTKVIRDSTKPDFRAILLRFRRKLDADIARKSLLAHGLVTYRRLRKEPPMDVLRIMTENLQW